MSHGIPESSPLAQYVGPGAELQGVTERKLLRSTTKKHDKRRQAISHQPRKNHTRSQTVIEPDLPFTEQNVNPR